MKKIYLSAILTFGFASAFSQITITDLDIGIGSTITNHQDTLMKFNVDLDATSGSGQVWNLSNLVKHETDIVTLEDPANTSLSDSFPDADFYGFDNEDSSYFFLSKTADQLSFVGAVEIDNNDTTFQNLGFPFMNFPASLGTTNTELIPNAFVFTDYLGMDPDGAMGPHPFIDSLRVRADQKIELKIDAEGIMQLPKGDFKVLRQVTNVYVVLHAEMYTNGNWSYISPTVSTLIDADTITTDTAGEAQVRFWTNDPNVNFALVSYTLDTNNTITNSPIEFLDLVPIDASVSEKSKLISTVYPNPANDFIILEMKDVNSVTNYEIVSISGKMIKSGDIKSQTNKIDISDLTTGAYILKVRNQETSEAIKLIKK